MSKKKKQTLQKREGYVSNIVPKTISRTRADIGSWKRALQEADNIDSPKRVRLQRLYDDILLDAHLTSQIELRTLYTTSKSSVILVNDKIDDELTQLINNSTWKREIDRAILSSIFRGTTLIELNINSDNNITVDVIPRGNVVPNKGLLLLDDSNNNGILYRNTKEYNTWLLEIGNNHIDYGLLNKAIPMVLFSRFAQSCWSELCEIYGIPPRVIKTDTDDPEMFARAEKMLKEMGSAAYVVIDKLEEFDFAQGISTNGDVYKNLIQLCSNQISLLISGAVVGQDTVNGNRSKEESSIKLLGKIVEADALLVKQTWNSIIIPALIKIGVLPNNNIAYGYNTPEDLEALWNKAAQAMPYYEVDSKWIEDKFGIKISGKQQSKASFMLNNSDFFG